MTRTSSPIPGFARSGVWALATLLSATLLTSGCGGSGAGTGAPSLAGNGPRTAAAQGHARIAVNVAWPKAAASRVIPRRTQSMTIELWANGAKVAGQTIASPATSAVFSDAPVGAVEARVVAYASTDATGIPVASGAATGTFADGQDVTLPVTLASRIVALEVYPNLFVMSPGDTADFDVYPDDANNDLVPSDPADYTFASSNPASASVDAYGTVTRKSGAGDAVITVTEINSGQTATIDVYTSFRPNGRASQPRRPAKAGS